MSALVGYDSSSDEDDDVQSQVPVSSASVAPLATNDSIGKFASHVDSVI